MCLGPEGGLPGEDFVQNRPEGVNVGRRAQRLLVAGGLLGCHVAGRAENNSSSGQTLILVDSFGQAEVGHFGSEIRNTKSSIQRARKRGGFGLSLQKDIGGL